MKFSEVTALLEKAGRKTYVLSGRDAQRKVLVCPELAGRVMGTSWAGENGPFGGFIDEQAFREGMKDIWDNWGGEERYWLGPEGGQFGLMFRDQCACFENYHVQEGFNRTPYEVIEVSPLAKSLTMHCRMRLTNKIGTRFDIEVTRRITVLDDCPYTNGCGDSVRFVGFQSESSLMNIGERPFTRETGALAHWHLGQFLVGEHVVGIIPYRTDGDGAPSVREDYFKDFCIGGAIASNRYWLLNNCALFKADGKVRAKIGQNRSRATGLLGSYNLETNEIVLLDYDFYPRLEYAASYWYEQPLPYEGDVISFSAEGPESAGAAPGRCYELEALSPALFLYPGESFTWRTRTMHLAGPRRVLAGICQRFLGPNSSQLEAFDRISSILKN
jgi:uncharacterized protein DUF6786